MRVRIENLGPVRKAELDLSKPLIVLTGPSNAGKTTLACVLHSLGKVSAVEAPKSALEWAKRLLAAKGRSLPIKSLSKVRADVLWAATQFLLQRLPDDLAAPPDRFSDTRITLIPPITYEGLKGEINYAYGPYTLSLRMNGKTVAYQLEGGQEDHPGSDRDEQLAVHLAHVASTNIQLDTIEHDLFVLPVERLAINLFARELAARRAEPSDELARDTRATLATGSKPRDRTTLHPRMIQDALRRAIRPSRTSKAGAFADLAQMLEKNVLGGSIASGSSEDLEFAPHTEPDAPLLLYQTSSAVKSLASLVIYLRNHACPGQRLFIDEPELHLHPDHQRRVARILARAVNRGLKLMISTHSDAIVRELDNLVMLGQDSDRARGLARKLGYDPSETLRAGMLGMYLVDNGRCRSLPVTETGFEVETIDDALNRLHRAPRTIYRKLFGD